MVLWFCLAAMTGLAVFAVLWPLSRPEPAAASKADAAFYKTQLAEIERDRKAGLFSSSEADSARTEAQLRLLRAAKQPRPLSETSGEWELRRRRASSSLIIVTIPLVAILLYGAYGSPHLSTPSVRERKPDTIDLQEAIARIEAHLSAQPDDGRGWETLAPVYSSLRRYGDAAKAYEQTLRLMGENASRLGLYGQALTAAEGGVVPMKAKEAFEAALKLDSASIQALFYLAQAAEQEGDAAKAKTFYERIIADAPPDAPWIAMIRRRLAPP